jgi:plastocyanin
MSRSALRLLLTLVAGLALLAVPGIAATAQDAAVAPHPSHIHEGTCAELNPQPAYPLTDVAAVAPDAPAGAVEVGHTTVEVSLDDLLAAPYAINVHESAENAANYIACGDVAGPVVDGLLLIPLREQNESGYNGIAALGANAAGGTDVSVYLAPPAGAAAAMVATPAVATETQAAAATETEAAAAQSVTVDIADFAFSPQVLEIPVGTTVTWTNSDTSQHTATANDGSFDSGILAQGASFSFTFDTPGTFDYICSLHPNMTGQIVVTG